MKKISIYNEIAVEGQTLHCESRNTGSSYDICFKKNEHIPKIIKTKEKQQCSTCTKQFFFVRSLVN